MKVLIAVAAVLALAAVAECGGHGGDGGDGGYGGGYGGGDLATPIHHAGPVVSKVFHAPPHPGYFHVPIPDHGFDKYVFHHPAPAHVVKGEGFGYSHHHH
ncbi:hypothetical protein GWI33_002092 [Rhynchophorus ferrugineus]|uniref:Uncharacterized protein n=1 Tax=Rhynchophorus ferrugineus TaxID=354439 RepID=A0A834J386_RHYFE|nr:hypothetical protein GWI33_002092 [Rhynchophorus ferrugineus]